MKEDLPWFKHYNKARNHPKMKALRGRYGPMGYGRFWMLNEIISEAPGARLDLSRKIILLSTAEELGLDLPALEEFISFLADPEIDLVNYSEGIVTTDQTQEDYVVVEGGRNRKRDMGNASAENRQSSAEKSGTSAEKTNRAEQSRAEQNRAEQLAAREDVSPEARAAEIYAIALAKAKATPGVKYPDRLARKMVADQDVLDEYERRHAPPPAPGREPHPDPCPHCGGKTIEHTQEPGRPPACYCPGCKTSWTYVDEWGWDEDPEKMVAVSIGTGFADTG